MTTNKKSSLPQHIIAVDTETKTHYQNEKRWQTFRLGYAIYLRNANNWIERGFQLDSIEDFWELLDDRLMKGTKLYIFSHNSAFDYHILKMDSYFSDRGFEIKSWIISGVFIVSASKYDQDGNVEHTIVYTDTMNFFRSSLKELGEAFGNEKMETPDFENVDDRSLMEYCKQDTEVLATVVKRIIDFVRENDLGNFKLTIAGQAINAFRHRFMPEKSILIHTHPEVLDLELDSYRGGRTETYRIGEFDNIYKLDINSMYPFIMKKYRFPTDPNDIFPVDSIPIGDIKELINDDYFILGKCKLDLKKPVVGTKRKMGNNEKLIFPIGRFTQTLCSPEIKFIFDNPQCGEIIEFERVVSYNTDNLFEDYVDFFYTMKKKAKMGGNEPKEKMSKLFLNSLYGKFAQRGYGDTVLVEDEIIKKMVMDITDISDQNTTILEGEKYIRLGDNVYKETEPTDRLAFKSVPIVASAVTAYARTYLYKFMETIGLDHIYYCDTDSIFTDEYGYEYMKNNGHIHETKLGYWDLEEIGTVKLYGAKDYQFNDKVKLKGVKSNAEYLGINDNGNPEYKQENFITKKMRLHYGHEDGRIYIRDMIKELSREYDKGIIEGDQVLPHELNEF